MKPLCIYHGNCVDGFGAAWCVRRRYLQDNIDIDFHAGVYQDPPPDVTGRDVIMVDFSYKRPVLEEIISKASSLLILDHHKTAAEDLADLPKARENITSHFAYAGAPGASHVGVVFDMERSGAGITWDYLFPDQQRPKLIDHIEDRDLWRFALEGTREIQAAVFSYPYDFQVWDMLMDSNEADLRDLFREGQAIERKHFKDIDELVKVVTREMKIGGHVVPMANLPYTLTSDAGHKLATGKPFAGCYWDTPEGRVFSLRSTNEGEDVSAIAKQYGGGGHRNASGFRIPFDQLTQFDV